MTYTAERLFITYSPYPGISREAIELLQRYLWPGNVRELSNLVEYLVNIVPEGEIIDGALLPPLFHTTIRSVPLMAYPPKTVCGPVEKEEEEGAKLKSVEKSLIEEALQRTRNKKQIAEELGIGVATLYRKIKKYGLQA